MSKNPYFAHLPTWRNRQDLAYALDNLPKALELMTASSPLLATYSCLPPSTAPFSASPSSIPRTRATTSSSSSSPEPSPPSRTSSLPPSSMMFSPSSSTTSLPYFAACGSSSSISAPPTPHGRSSPSFKERFMLDLTKELQHCQSPLPPRSHQQENDSYSYARHRRDSGSSTSSHYACGLHRQSPEQMQFMQAQRPQHQSNNMTSQASHNSTTHLNTSTINNNANPYYPLQFSTKAKAMAYLIEILQWLQKEPCGCDLTRGCYCGQDGVEDHVGKSPCYVCGEWYPDRRDSHTATTLEAQEDHGHNFAHSQHHQEKQNGRAWHEQGSLRHHVAESRVKKWLDAVWRPPLTPATSPEQENVRQFGRAVPLSFASVATEHLGPRSPTSPRLIERTLEPDQSETRSWTFHDIEMEARRKSRSRQNSTQRHQLGSFPDGYSQPFSPSIAALVVNEPNNNPPCSERTRAQSYQDPTSITIEPHHRPSAPCASSSFASSTSEATVPFSTSRAKKPTRASTTPACFVIPQEILDPSYRSPTFRIKSWTPPPSATESDMVATKMMSLDGHGHSGEVNVQKSGRFEATEGQNLSEEDARIPVAAPAPAPLFQFNFTSQRFKAAVEASMVTKTVNAEEALVLESTVQKTATCSDVSTGLVEKATSTAEEDATPNVSSHTRHHSPETVSFVAKLDAVDSCVEANEDASVASQSLTVAKNNEGGHKIQKSAPMSPMTPSAGSSASTTTTSAQSPVMATAAKSNWTSFQRLMVKMSKSDMALSRSGIVQLDSA
ncbi:hypothetical protein BGZ82_008146 [Podila clonocystis]|nr:hypothetical protein BGZ82_008146 [Podila clonocystis]